MRTTTPSVPRGAPPGAVARAGRAGPGGVRRVGAARRRGLCGSPAAGKAREAVLQAGAAGLGCRRRAGEERRGRAGPGCGRGWLGGRAMQGAEPLKLC